MNIDLDAIRARADAATDGPWRSDKEWGAITHGPDAVVHAFYADDCESCAVNIEDEATVVIDPADAEFIAHAREDIPALLAEVERLQSVARAERADEKRIHQIIESGLIAERDQAEVTVERVRALAAQYETDDKDALNIAGQHHPIAAVAAEHLRAALEGDTK